MIKLLEKFGVSTTGYNGLAPEFSPPHWAWLLLFITVFILIGWWAYSATRLLDSRPRKTAIVILRVCALFLLGLILLYPALVLEQRNPIRPRLVILWDVSRSMGLSAGDGKSTRLEEAIKWWQSATSLRNRLADNYRAEAWLFAESVSPAGTDTFTKGPENKPEGERTDILGALRRVVSGGDAPAAVILVSDGADNVSLAEAASRKNGVAIALKGYPSPVFVAPMGKETKSKDIGIEKVESPEYGFVRNAVEVKVTISARGFAGTETPVTIMDGSRVVSTKTVKLDSDDGKWSVEMAFTPDQVGDFLFTVLIPNYEGEAVYENNSRVFPIRILRDKIRVMHVVGRPSWDQRFLREAFVKDPTIELISFYILREPLDAPMASTDDLSLIPFPTEELFDTKIRTFDLIVFQNFSWIPYLQYGRLLQNIHDFVTEFGGGFVMIGGPQSYTAGRYAGTPIQEILPVEMPQEGQVFQVGEYHPKLTEAGIHHPITAFDTNAEVTRKLWESFPPLEGWNVVGAAKTGATVLLDHPFQTTQGGNMPLLTVWSVGRGRVMSLATDTTWKWSFNRAVEGQTSEEYQRFWRAAVRWLVGDPEGKRVRARTDKTRYAPGQVVHLRVKALDRNYAPVPQARLEASLEGQGSSKPIEGFQPDGDEFATEIKDPGPGGWRIKVSAFDNSGEKLGEDETVFVVEQQGREFSPPWPNPELLESIAKATGGEVWKDSRAIKPEKLPQPRAWRVVGRRRLPLWDNWIAGGLLLFVLATEWFVRRRWGLN